MRKHCKFILIVFCLLHFSRATYSQDVGFSQFYNQPLLRNPALAGIFTGDVRLTASYRSQWQSVTVPYRTFAVSAEVKLPFFQLFGLETTPTLGLQLMRDVAGTSQFSTAQVLPAFNASIRVSENSFVSLAFMGGLRQQRFDPTKLVLGDQFVAGSNGTFSIAPFSNQVFNNTSVNYYDLSTGLSFNSSIGDNIDYYIGTGLFHVLEPTVGFYEGNRITLNKKLAFNIGLSTAINDIDELILYGDFFSLYQNQFKYVGNNSFQAGMLIKHQLFVPNDEGKSITAGVLYRFDDAIIPVVELELSKFNIGISYDVNINKLVVASQARGGFELTLSYKDLFNSRKADLMGVKCPKFGR